MSVRLLWPYALIFVAGFTGYVIYGAQPFWLLTLAHAVGLGWGVVLQRYLAVVEKRGGK